MQLCKVAKMIATHHIILIFELSEHLFSFTIVCTLSYVVVPRTQNRESTHCTLDHTERIHGPPRVLRSQFGTR